MKADDRQRKRVESYFAYNYATTDKRKMLEMKDLSSYLPHSLLNEVIHASYKDILKPIFKDYKSDNLLKELSIVLTNKIYMPEDYII